jgi:hypothetical protein
LADAELPALFQLLSDVFATARFSDARDSCIGFKFDDVTQEVRAMTSTCGKQRRIGQSDRGDAQIFDRKIPTSRPRRSGAQGQTQWNTQSCRCTEQPGSSVCLRHASTPGLLMVTCYGSFASVCFVISAIVVSSVRLGSTVSRVSFPKDVLLIQIIDLGGTLVEVRRDLQTFKGR